MYTTRRLSQLLSSPDLVSAHPDGPNSGYLIIQDEETYSLFGLLKNHTLYNLPFPQNKELTVKYVSNVSDNTSRHQVFLIPVLNQPLSSNLYYAINPHGKHIGEAFTCSREDDKITCCLCRCIAEVWDRPLDPHNVYQQFKIFSYDFCTTVGFSAGSIASDGFPPRFLRREGWTIHTRTPGGQFKLDEAEGIDSRLRAHLPGLDSSTNVVGKWICPFMFIKEGNLRYQVKRSMYYEMTLEQRWENIFSYQRNVFDHQMNSVMIDVEVEKEEVFIKGNKAVWIEQNGLIWFTSNEDQVGLREEIVKRMKWEQEKGGWVDGEEKIVKISKVEEFKELSEWNEFKCSVLVERFNLKRTDGSLVLSYDFKHSHQLKSVWE